MKLPYPHNLSADEMNISLVIVDGNIAIPTGLVWVCMDKHTYLSPEGAIKNNSFKKMHDCVVLILTIYLTPGVNIVKVRAY